MYYVFQVTTLGGDVNTWSGQQIEYLQEPTSSTFPPRSCTPTGAPSHQRSLSTHRAITWSAHYLELTLMNPSTWLAPSDRDERLRMPESTRPL